MFDRRVRFLAFAIATVTAGCNEGSLSPGNDGGGSGGGAGGTGGATAKSPPSCLRDLVAACPLEASCQSVAGASGATERACYASGETVAVSYAGTCTISSPDLYRQVFEVRKADGSPCYSFETACYCGGFCEDSTWTWRNAAGDIVATGSSDITGGDEVICAGTRETCQLGGLGSPSFTGSCRPPPPAVGCTAGSCGDGGADGPTGP
jgi:hypothetical protein